jgi:hypothetical protein
MYQVLELDLDEQLVCLFFRGEGEPQNIVQTVDFERRMNREVPEGGISFYRAAVVSFFFIVDRVRRKPRLNRGIALISTRHLLDLGFTLKGDPAANAGHICLHCNRCDGTQYNCSAIGPCAFITPEDYRADNDMMRKALSEAMTVVIEATNTREQLLSIFGRDVLQDDPLHANEEYIRRWQNAQVSITTVE